VERGICSDILARLLEEFDLLRTKLVTLWGWAVQYEPETERQILCRSSVFEIEKHASVKIKVKTMPIYFLGIQWIILHYEFLPPKR
jgi:hypothetical protein